MQSMKWFTASVRARSTSTKAGASRPSKFLFEAPAVPLCQAARGPTFSSAALSGCNLPACGSEQGAPSWRSPAVRRLHLEARHSHSAPQPNAVAPSLPAQCTGCGALSQTTEPHRAGYFNPERNDVKRCLGLEQPKPSRPSRRHDEDAIVQAALQAVDRERLVELGVDVDTLLPQPALPDADRLSTRPPRCDRCHNLVHHSTGVSIYHPSVEALHETIEESPFKYNHVYHVIDAADFPMSLLPRIHQLLEVMPLRSRNRRSRAGRFYGDRKTEMSFVITRADLLAPRKEQVDRLMPYLKETLREALGRRARNVRLGSVRCVSAKRSWWTKELKEDIWERGGACWMVGKVNVGKSQLFEAVFPKGRMAMVTATPHSAIEVPVTPRRQDQDDGSDVAERAMAEVQPPAPGPPSSGHSGQPLAGGALEHEQHLDEFSLLPPARPETNFPEMPVVSSLPGTTASPIRVPFGNGRGELIDLPGLERTSLDMHVKPEHRSSLLMKSRLKPKQHVLKPSKSLLIGGFIRITPRTPDLTFLAYAFTPIDAHLTSTDKAIAIQGQTGELNVENISVPGTAEKVRHAGCFALRWDVTKVRAGPITRRDAVNMKVERLPFRVVATDILIEGCGWVEVVAQVRAKQLFAPRPEPRHTSSPGEIRQTLDLSTDPVDETDPADPNEPNWPMVDVYTPEGKYISARGPMNAWLVNKSPKPERGRPRKSMKGAKKLAKAAARAAKQAEA